MRSASPGHVRWRAYRRACIAAVALHAAVTAPLLGQVDTIGTPRPMFTYRDAILAATFVGITMAVKPIDKHYALKLQRQRTQESRFLQKTSVAVRTVADPGSVVIGTSMYAIGRLTSNERLADLGLHGTEALAVGAATAFVLKGSFGRERPYAHPEDPNPFNWQFLRGFHGEDKYRSFPSGHSVAAFAAAAAVTSETSRWWPSWAWAIGTTMYGGATAVGISRMYNNRHWASDVAMGAAIGTFAGNKVVRYHHTHPGTRIDRWLLSGRFAPRPDGGVGLSLSALPMSASMAERLFGIPQR